MSILFNVKYLPIQRPTIFQVTHNVGWQVRNKSVEPCYGWWVIRLVGSARTCATFHAISLTRRDQNILIKYTYVYMYVTGKLKTVKREKCELLRLRP